MATWIDDVPAQALYDNGAQKLPTVRTWNLIGADISYDSTNERWDIDMSGVMRAWKEPARLATDAALPAYTRTDNNILANAVGALPNIDGVAAIVGDILLLTPSGTASNIDNGKWRVTSIGGGASQWSLTRADDMNETAEVYCGVTVPIEEGTLYGGHAFRMTTANPITLNTSVMVFEDVGALVSLVTTVDSGAVASLGANNTVLTNPASAAGGVWATIVDANVNAAAAIAGTKVNPAFGNQNISVGDTHYIQLAATNPAAAGTIRLAHAGSIYGYESGGGNARLFYWDGTGDNLLLGEATDVDETSLDAAVEVNIKNANTDIVTIDATGMVLTGDRDFTPTVDNNGECGTAALRWKLVRGVTVTAGDLAFDDQLCPVCTTEFADDDCVVWRIYKREPDEAGKMISYSVPVHIRCCNG